MKNLICILTLLFSEFAYSKSFNILKFEITGNERASSSVKVINEALKTKEVYSWSNTFDEESKIMINGIQIENLNVSNGNIYSFLTKEDVEVGELVIPAFSEFWVYDDSTIEASPQNKNHEIRYKTLSLSSKAHIYFNREGKLLSAVSGKFQSYNGITYFKNDVLLADKNGNLTALNEVRHFGKKYNPRNYQQDNTIPLESLRVARIKNRVHIVLGFTDKNEYLGNICKHCKYTLCQNDDHFYVYMIRSIDYKNDIFQGKPIKDKFDQEQYFKYGDSTTPIVRNMEDDEPFSDVCSFDPFKG